MNVIIESHLKFKLQMREKMVCGKNAVTQS